MATPWRWRLTLFVTTAILVAGTSVFTGCSNTHRQVSAAEFVRLLRQGPQSMSAVDYIGSCGDRVYLSHWRMGLLGGETHDVCSVAIDELPPAERDAVRDGRNPWARTAPTTDPGLTADERRAVRGVERLPPALNPTVVVLRCAAGQRARVALDGHDRGFTDGGVVHVPTPCDLVLVVTADEPASVRIGAGEAVLRLHPDEPVAWWRHVRHVGPLEVAVEGASSRWAVELRAGNGGELGASAGASSANHAASEQSDEAAAHRERRGDEER